MNCRGNIVIAILFVLLLSFSGLALLTHSLLHSKIIAARRGKWQVCGKLEQAILLQLHRYRQQLDDSDMNQFIAPENDFFNNVNFPDVRAGVFQVKNHFRQQALTAGSDYFKIRVFNRLTAGSEKSRLEYGGQASVDLLKGTIPLSEFSLLVNKEITGTQADYLAGKGVDWSGQLINLPGKPAVTGDCRGLLAVALKLPGTFPDWRQIREKFNLELSDAPIPPGIYLTFAAGLVETIFVEGDLRLLEFRAVDGLQSIAFGQDTRLSELSYRPGQESLLWSGQEMVSGYRFAEKIIVHGNIWTILQSGSAAFTADSRIQVVASGKMIVSSGLESENLDLQKTKFANLLLMTSDKDFFSGAEINADIVLAPAAGSTVEAHLLAAGKVVHGDGLLKLSGSLIAGDIENSGRLQVRALAGQFDFPAHLGLKNFQCLQNFRVHFIAEGSDE
jgi:hypothetical protein